VRLVVDTGIHSKGWTREQVVEFMRKSGAVDEPTIQSETDRYIAWPAQALSYKLGQLKISELRQRAQKELGASFDIRTFHDEILETSNYHDHVLRIPGEHAGVRRRRRRHVHADRLDSVRRLPSPFRRVLSDRSPYTHQLTEDLVD
jgi:hypothetical protein